MARATCSASNWLTTGPGHPGQRMKHFAPYWQRQYGGARLIVLPFRLRQFTGANATSGFFRHIGVPGHFPTAGILGVVDTPRRNRQTGDVGRPFDFLKLLENDLAFCSTRPGVSGLTEFEFLRWHCSILLR
jgi:hypothetical protein